MWLRVRYRDNAGMVPPPFACVQPLSESDSSCAQDIGACKTAWEAAGYRFARSSRFIQALNKFIVSKSTTSLPGTATIKSRTLRAPSHQAAGMGGVGDRSGDDVAIERQPDRFSSEEGRPAATFWAESAWPPCVRRLHRHIRPADVWPPSISRFQSLLASLQAPAVL